MLYTFDEWKNPHLFLVRYGSLGRTIMAVVTSKMKYCILNILFKKIRSSSHVGIQSFQKKRVFWQNLYLTTFFLRKGIRKDPPPLKYLPLSGQILQKKHDNVKSRQSRRCKVCLKKIFSGEYSKTCSECCQDICEDCSDYSEAKTDDNKEKVVN